MELKVLRQEFTRNATIGKLLVDGEFECWTLEDCVRPAKIYGETAIPAGRYQVVISMSERFKTRLPLLVDVPEYTGVRIHPGNTKADTLGCLLVGQSKATDSIGASRAAFSALMPKLEAAAQNEKIYIELVNEGQPLPAERGRRAAPKKARKPVKKAAKKAVRKTTAKKAVPKKIAAKKLPAKKTAAKKTAARKAAVPSTLASKTPSSRPATKAGKSTAPRRRAAAKAK